MAEVLERARSIFGDDRLLDSALAALFIAFIAAFVTDLAIDAAWIPELFFGVLILAFILLYRSGKAPPRPSGDLLTGFGWMLVLFVLTLAVLRVYTHINDAVS